ncbi:MAG: hypothetical protein H0Z28_05815 [Archaeoglobus sp.]|nr:hypothetical protein [Archaeoglobus sp.]
MNPLIIFALMVPILLNPTAVKPGEEISVSLYGNGTYVLEISDPNIYFNESLTNKIVATPGIYEIKVGFETTPGMKTLSVRYENGSLASPPKNFLVLPLSEADLSNLIQSASKVESELISLKKQIITLENEIKQKEAEIEKLKSQPQSNGEKIKDLEAQIEKMRLDLLTKENEVSKLKLKINELNGTISSLQTQLEEVKSEKAELESQMSSLGSPEFVEATKLGFFFVLAFTAGILISLLRR